MKRLARLDKRHIPLFFIISSSSTLIWPISCRWKQIHIPVNFSQAALCYVENAVDKPLLLCVATSILLFLLLFFFSLLFLLFILGIAAAISIDLRSRGRGCTVDMGRSCVCLVALIRTEWWSHRGFRQIEIPILVSCSLARSWKTPINCTFRRKCFLGSGIFCNVSLNLL